MSYDGFIGRTAERELIGPDPSLFTRKITLKKFTTTADPASGDQVRTVQHEFQIYAWVRFGASREIDYGDGTQSELTAQAVINYQPALAELDAGWVYELDGQEWDIVGVEWPFGYKRYPLLRATHTFKRGG